jgi:hypothetical protein
MSSVSTARLSLSSSKFRRFLFSRNITQASGEGTVDCLLSAVTVLGFAWESTDVCCSNTHSGQRRNAASATPLFAPFTPRVPSTPPTATVALQVANGTFATATITINEPQGVASNGGASITSYTVRVVSRNSTTLYNVTTRTQLPIRLVLTAPPLLFSTAYNVSRAGFCTTLQLIDVVSGICRCTKSSQLVQLQFIYQLYNLIHLFHGERDKSAGGECPGVEHQSVRGHHLLDEVQRLRMRKHSFVCRH